MTNYLIKYRRYTQDTIDTLNKLGKTVEIQKWTNNLTCYTTEEEKDGLVIKLTVLGYAPYSVVPIFENISPNN